MFPNYYKVKAVEILFSGLFLISCSNHKYEDDFYNYSRASYIFRLPLIEPYVLTTDKKDHWFLSTDTDGHFRSVFLHARIDPQWLTRAMIIDTGFIFAYTDNAANSGCHCQLWYAMDLINKKDTILNSEITFRQYLEYKKIHIDSLYDIEYVYDIFEKTGKLPQEWNTAINSLKRKTGY